MSKPFNGMIIYKMGVKGVYLLRCSSDEEKIVDGNHSPEFTAAIIFEYSTLIGMNGHVAPRSEV